MSWTACISMVMECGSGAGVPSYWECHIVAASPSSTLLAGKPGDASLAVAVQPVRGSSGGATWPRIISISAADDHGPRLSASVIAVRRIYRAESGWKAMVFSAAVSAHVPADTGAEKTTSSRLVSTRNCPMRPFGLPSWRGRYLSPDTSRAAFMSMVTECGSGAGAPSHWECQIVSRLPSRTLLTGEPLDASLAVAVQPVRGSGSDGALNDSGAVAAMRFMCFP